MPAGSSSRRARSACACAVGIAIAIGVAGCGSTSSSGNSSAVTVSGSTLSIYASQPPADTGGQVATDVLDAERLAFDQSSHRVGPYTLRFGVVHADEVSADARDVIQDTTSIAYLGEIEPGTSGVSAQITNQVGLLQVSPTDTAAFLTKATSGVDDSPQHFYPAHSTYGETFGRVVPTTAAEATAIVNRMKHDGVHALQIGHDATDYGVSVADAVRTDANAAGISAATGGAYFYAGAPTSAAAAALNHAAAGGATLYAPSALYDPAFVATLSGAAQQRLTVDAPGFLSSGLNSAGRAFVQSFRSRFGGTPVPQAIFGYAAVKAVIAALQQAGTHADVRQTVVSDFRGLTQTADQSVLGAYAIKGGDTNITPFVFAGVSGGTLVPRAAG